MDTLVVQLRIFRIAFNSGVADWRAMYTVKTWTFGWLGRILCQVVFFVLVGRYIGVPGTVRFLVIGNAVFILAQSVLFSIFTTCGERFSGTYPFLVCAPGPMFAAFVGRSAQWVLDGALCSVASILLLGPLFGLTMPMPTGLLVVPIVFLTACSVYGFGLTVGGLVLRMVHMRALAANVSLFFLMLLTGVQVPGTFWPSPLRLFTQMLPLTHGLDAVRDLLAGAGLGRILTAVVSEVGVGAVWFAAAAWVFHAGAEKARRNGTVDFGG